MRWDEAQGRYVRSESDYGGLDPSVIRSVLGEIGGDAKSLFVDPLKPLYREFQNMAKEPEDRVLTHPRLGSDLGLPFDRYGKPIDQSKPVLIGDDPSRGSDELSFRSAPSGLSDVYGEGVGVLGGLSEATPLGMAAPVLGGIVRSGIKKGPVLSRRLNELVGDWKGKKIKGTPAGTRPQDIAKRQRQMHQLVGEGKTGWKWYEKMNQMIKDYVPEQHQPYFTGLLSTTSSASPVAQNIMDTLTGYAQTMRGMMPNVGMFQSQSKRIGQLGIKARPSDVLNEIEGAKKWTNYFKNNYGDFDAVTNDRYMLRLGGFHGSSLTDNQYKYLTRMVEDTAEQFGIKPAEAQAGAWSAFKARWDAVQPRNQKLAKKRGWWDEANGRIYKEHRKEFHDMTFKDAMKHTPTQQEIETAAHGGMVAGWGKGDLPSEYVAGFKHWPELESAPSHVMDDYHKAMDEIFIDQRTGKNKIFEELGIPHKMVRRTEGVWEGQGRAGYDIQILLPENAAGEVPPDIINRLHMGMAAMGRATKQEAIGYYKAIEMPTPESNIFRINLDRTLSTAETKLLDKAMNNLGLGEGYVVPINRERGVDLYYTTDNPNVTLDLAGFQSKVDQRLNTLNWIDKNNPASIATGSAQHKGEYLTYEGITGQKYRHGIDNPDSHWEALANDSGRGGETKLYDVYAQQVKTAEQAFAKRWGLQDPHNRPQVGAYSFSYGSRPVLGGRSLPESEMTGGGELRQLHRSGILSGY